MRHKFYSALRARDESAREWAARLKGLAADCKFGDELKVVVRDLFVSGYGDGPIQERLFEEDPTSPLLTLAKLVDLATGKEAAMEERKQRSSLAIKTEPSDVFSVRRRNKGNPPKTASFKNPDSRGQPCKHCGRSNHESSDCRYKDYACNLCKSKGHLAPVCPSKPRCRGKKGHKYLDPQPVAANCVNEDEVNLCDSFFSILNSAHQETAQTDPKPYTIALEIYGEKIPFEIDTGSFYNVISAKFHARHFSHVKLRENDISLSDYIGHIIRPKGKISVPVKSEKLTCKLTFYVVERGGPPLIGREGLQKLKCSSLFKTDPEGSKRPSDFKADPEAPTNIEKLLSKYSMVFDESMGTFSKYRLSLKIAENAVPKFFKPRRLPIALREKVDNEIDRLVREGILEPVTRSEWATPIVPVLKADGTIRICGDYRLTVNPVLKPSSYTLPTMEHLCSDFAGARLFSKIDLRDAFQQCELDESSRSLTTINTHRGLFRYRRLCFGISNSPDEFQEVMERLLQGIKGVKVLLDDIVVSGQNAKEHNSRLEAVLRVLQNANLRVKPAKCKFSQPAIEYLGHIFDKDGCHPTRKHIEAISSCPVPTNADSLRSFLGMVTYYIKFVPNAAKILEPLYFLLRKSVKWSWTRHCDSAFKKVKKILTSYPVLSHFNPKMPLRLTVDASGKAVGAILSHVYPDHSERPIAYASKILTDCQRKYAQIEREAYAIVYGVTKFRDYLFAKRFELVTDHRPLLHIFGEQKGVPIYAANRLQRWAYLLSGYNYTMKCVRSQENGADFLSRIETKCSDTIGPDKLEDISHLNFIHETCPFRVNWKSIRRHTRSDPIISQVASKIVAGAKLDRSNDAFKPYVHREHELTIDHGCLMWGFRVIVPEQLRAAILRELHDTHIGATKMKAYARNYFWWPNLDSDVEATANACETCCKFRGSPPKSQITPWPHPLIPWTRLHMDFLGPMNQGRLNVFIVTDSTSKWIEAFIVPTANAQIAIEKLSELFARFGLPRSITSDGARYFTGQEMTAFLDGLGIRHNVGAPFHPQTNGAAESAVKIVKSFLKKAIFERRQPLPVALNKFLFQYRNTEHAATKESPATMMLKRRARTLFDPLTPSPEDIADMAHQRMTSSSGNRSTRYMVNDMVWARDYRSNPPRWIEAVISEVLGPLNYRVSTRDGLVWKRHLDQLWSRIIRKSSGPSNQDAEAPPTETTQAEEPSASPSEDPESSPWEWGRGISTPTPPKAQKCQETAQSTPASGSPSPSSPNSRPRRVRKRPSRFVPS
ncbi:unnamed protein product [Nesidiocoris tenuis]|uniref:RNA-directed DNA polymerase n=1 Tax=Nesidiocoris tenuis TaxID=355587 RepID=A0A6H5HEX0_9HEMI|nr:unnamed protein product [Nesidiocoris tenuis]